MTKFDVLKQYKIKIGADTKDFLKALTQLEQEATDKLKDLNLSEGLRSDIEKLTKEIGEMKSSLTKATDEINTNITNIGTDKLKDDFQSMSNTVSKSIADLNTKVGEFKALLEVLNDGGKLDNLSSGLNKSFTDLSDNITRTLVNFKEMSKFIEDIRSGAVNVGSSPKTSDVITKTIRSQMKALEESINNYIKLEKNLNQIIDEESIEGFNMNQVNQMESVMETILRQYKELKRLGADVGKMDSLFQTGKGIEFIERQSKSLNAVLRDIDGNIPDKIERDVRFRIRLDKDVDGTPTVTALVNRVKDVVNAAQKELKKQGFDVINIKTGLAEDVSNIELTEKEKEQIEKAKDGTKLVKAVKINANSLKQSVYDAIKDLNKELKAPTAPKIEVEVVGKVNPETVEESAGTIAYEVEDAQHRLKNNLNNVKLSGGNVAIDPSSGIATEGTLSDIKTILSQWDATGVPGTQSEEFKRQLKNKAENEKVSSDFDKYFRNRYRNTRISEEAKGINDTTASFLSRLYHNMDEKDAITALIKSPVLRKGGDKGRAFLQASDYYKKSFMYDGKEYARFAPEKMLLTEWQDKLNKLFDASFDPDSRESLFNVSKKIVPVLNDKGEKILNEEGNILTEEIEITSALRTRRDVINKSNKTLRENLKLNGVEFKKQGGTYTTEILDEKGTFTSNEDVYAKARKATSAIKENVREEYEYQITKKKDLEEQRSIMQQIFLLEEKQRANGSLENEENDLLLQLRNRLRPSAIEISDNKQHDALVARKEELANKLKTKGLKSDELLEFRSLDSQIESLFVRTDDLSKYVMNQLSINADTGISIIDGRINEVEKTIDDLIDSARSDMSKVANDFNNYFQQNATETAADGSLNKKAYKQNRRLRDHYDNVFESDIVKSQAHYDWNAKEIQRLKKENSYFEKFITQNKDGKAKSSIDTSALGKDDKAIYYRNQQRIKQLETQNLLYAEQNDLVDELNKKGKQSQKDLKTEGRSNITYLHLPSSEKEGYEKLDYKLRHSGVDKESFIRDLSDDELIKALSSLEQVNNAIDKKSKLTDEEIETLVQNELNEYASFLKETLKKEEDALVKMEKDGASKKQINAKTRRIANLTSSIDAIENPAANYAEQLETERENLRKINQEQEGLVANLKEKLKLSDDDIDKVKKLYSLQKAMKEEETNLQNANLSAYNYYKNRDVGQDYALVYSDGLENQPEIFEDNVLAQLKETRAARSAYNEYKKALEQSDENLLKIIEQDSAGSALLTQAILESEEKRHETEDKIFDIQARSHGFVNKNPETRHKLYRSYLGGQAFDSFDTSLDQEDIYTKRVAILRGKYKTQDESSVKTARDLLISVKQEVQAREEAKQKALEIHEIEKNIVKTRQDGLKNVSKDEERLADLEKEHENIESDTNKQVSLLDKEKERLENNDQRFKINKQIAKEQERLNNKEDFKFLKDVKRESEIFKAQHERIEQLELVEKVLADLQDDEIWKSKYDKPLRRNDGESDTDYQAREANKRQTAILSYQNKINELQAVHNAQLEQENNELIEIHKNRKKYASAFGSDSSEENILGLAKEYLNTAKSFKNINTKLSDKSISLKDRSNLEKSLSENNTKAEEIKSKFINSYVSSIASGIYDELDEQILKLRNQKDKSYLSGTAEDILNRQKQRESEIEKYSKNIKTAQNKPIKFEEYEIDNAETRLRKEAEKLDRIESLEKHRNELIAERDSMLAIENRRIEQILFENIQNEQYEKERGVLTGLENKRNARIAEIDKEKESMQSVVGEHEKQIKKLKENIALSRQINDFQAEMNEDQKKASLGVDLQLLSLYDMQEEQKTLDHTSDRYKELSEEISQAQKQLELFKQEAKEAGLTFSETTGRMYLGDKNKDIGLPGVNIKKHGIVPYESQESKAKALNEEQQRFNAAKYQEYQYHSKIVDEVQKEYDAINRMHTMWRTAGMSDEQAEIAIQIQRVVSSTKNWNKLSEKQKGYLDSLYSKAKALGLELKQDAKIADKSYVKELVDYQTFASNPEQYATNKYLRGMMLDPSAKSYDTHYIENYRAATESTLQNIQKILQTGVKVKVLGKDSKLNLYKYEGLNPRVNIDADKPGYIAKKNSSFNKNNSNNTADLLKKAKKTRNDWNRLISQAKSEDEKNKYRTQAIETGYFALNKNKNVVGISGKNNKNKTNKEIIAATKEYIAAQKLAINVEDLFAGKLKKTSEKLDEKAKKTKDNVKATKSSKSASDNHFKLQAILNDPNAKKEDKQSALDKLLAKGFQLGEYDGKRKGQYFAGKTDNTSADITKKYAEANGLIIKSLDEVQKKEKETTAVVQEESKKQEQIKQYTAAQLNAYIKRSKTDEGKNKWRDVAKTQGFELDEDLNVKDLVDEEAFKAKVSQELTAIQAKVKDLTRQIEVKEAEGKNASAEKEELAKTNAAAQQLQSILSKEDSPIVAPTNEDVKQWREYGEAVALGLERVERAQNLKDFGITDQDTLYKLASMRGDLFDALGKDDWQIAKDNPNKIKDYLYSAFDKAFPTDELKQKFRSSVAEIFNIDSAATGFTGAGKLNKTGGNGYWTHFATYDKQTGKKTDAFKGDYTYKLYGTFEDIANLNKETISSIMSALSQAGFKGQLKVPGYEGASERFGSSDQIVIHGNDINMQEIAYRVLTEQFSNVFSFVSGGFDNKDGSFSQILSGQNTQAIVDDAKSQIATELAKGMKDTGTVQEAAKKLADTVEETVKDELGINSPSKVMEQLGLWTTEGFVKGVMESSDSVKKAIQDMLASGKVTEEEVKSLIGWDGYLDDGKSMFKRNTNAGKQAWGSLKGALSDKDLFNYQKNMLSLTKSKQLVKDAGIDVNDDEIKALGEKVGRQWQIAEDAVRQYIETKKEALSTGAVDSEKPKGSTSSKKTPWKFDINAASIDTLNKKAKQGQAAIDNGADSAEEWKEVLPDILARIKQIKEEKLNVLDVTEQITDNEEEAVKLLAKRIGMSDVIDVTKNRRINNETAEERISYKVKDSNGNTATFNKMGDQLILDRSSDIIDKKAKELKDLMNKVFNTVDNDSVKHMKDFMPELFSGKEAEKIQTFKNAYAELLKVVKSFNEGKDSFTDEEKNSINKYLNIIKQIKSEFNGEGIELGQISFDQAKNLQATLIGLANATEKSAIMNVKFANSNREMTYQVRNGKDMLDTYKITVDNTGKAVKALVKSEKYLTSFQKGVGSLSKKFKELFNYAIASVSVYEIINFFKRGVSVVQEFDAAMTELYKVANDSTEALEKFGLEAYNIAKQIGSTGTEIINSAADWSKLGYSIKEASELAKNSALYSNVGDMDIDTATEHMVSTLKAFNIEAKDSINIVDKFNEVGNNYAITSAGIGEALENSAASLVAAGNDIDESIALITAGNIISQDPSSVGNAMKVLSLRIRGSKAELEELGEETDGVVSSTSKLREELKALTGVDIMLDENTYKSTYDIMLEISKVWDKLTDVSQAAVLEKLAGKTRASVVAGLLQQTETLENVYKDSIGAAGSAVKENERYMESIQGHIDLLKNQWQEMWVSEVNRDFINLFVDFGAKVLELVDNIGLLKVAIAGVGTIAYNKFLKSKDGSSGGRVKKFALIA